MSPLVDDSPDVCPACGKANCTSHDYQGLDPRRPVPRKEGPGWDPKDPTAPPEAKEQEPKRDKMIRGPAKDKALRSSRSKRAHRTGPPPAPKPDEEAKPA